MQTKRGNMKKLIASFFSLLQFNNRKGNSQECIIDEKIGDIPFTKIKTGVKYIEKDSSITCTFEVKTDAVKCENNIWSWIAKNLDTGEDREIKCLPKCTPYWPNIFLVD